MRQLPALCLIIFIGAIASAHAQQAQHESHEQTSTGDPSSHDAAMTGPLGLSRLRDGSGTSWQPDNSPMFAIPVQLGSWTVMLQENAFLQYIRESGNRGDDQFGSINWVMGMARRPFAGGQLTARGMVSVERLTVGECGYPDLLASGETCKGDPLHDRQHPHDLFMEVAGEYVRPIAKNLALQVYGGAAGEPALGPVAYPHRLSALPNPIAPIAHHWLDSTHITFGVVTGGIYGRRWKLEGSLFNGREPDEERYNIDFAKLNSYSGRFWFLPNERWAIQVSSGHLKDAEPQPPFEPFGSPITVNRTTASVSYNRPRESGGMWASTFAWGVNGESGRTKHALLVESALDLDPANTVFARTELVGKTGPDISVAYLADVLTISKTTVGYTRRLRRSFAKFSPGVGGAFSFSVLPEDLAIQYSRRTPVGFVVFVNVRPTRM